MSDWLLEVRDEATLRREKALARWSTLTVIERFCMAGTWSLTGRTVDLGDLASPGKGLVISRDGHVVLSGPVTDISPTASTATVTGTSDWFPFNGRVCYPVPASSWSDQSAAAYDVRSGARETVALQYINVNAGPGALALSGENRVVAGLAVPASSGRGGAVTRRVRFNYLSDLVGDLGEGGDLRFDVVHDETGGAPRRLVTVTPVDDKSADVRFGDHTALANGVVTDWSYQLTVPTATRALVAGGNQLTTRVTELARDATAETLWHAVVETFVDQRQTTTVSELTQAAADAIKDTSAPVQVVFTVASTPGCQYAKDWRVGDKVGVTLLGTDLSNRVREVTTTVGAPGQDTPEQIRAVVGTRDASAWTTATQRQLARAGRRISNLERNQ